MNEIFTSTVVAALVTGLLTLVWNLINQRRQNSLKYITEDRKAWRDDMRKIIVKLEKTKIKNINTVLDMIKCRINAYGLEIYLDDNKKVTERQKAFKDTHIWKCIFEIESIINQNHLSKQEYFEFKKQKKLLINYLCALLKHDWERAKAETRGGNNSIYSIVTLFIGMIIFIICIYNMHILPRCTIEKIVFYDIFSAVVYLIPYVFSIIPSLRLFSPNRPIKSLIIIFNSISGIIMIIIYLIICLFNCEFLVPFLIPIFFMIVSIGLNCAQQIEVMNADVDYVNTIKILDLKNEDSKAEENNADIDNSNLTSKKSNR